MDMQVLDTRRDASGGYKVDVSRGSRVGRVSSEWFSRPDDERFLSLGDLARSVRGRSERSRTRVVETALIHVEANRNDPERLALMLPGAEAPVTPTHWSFGQLASQVGAPAAYLRQLPAPLAAINLQYGLTSNRAERIKTLETDDPVSGGRLELRAVTSPDYGRIYDHELVEAVQKIAGNGTGDTRWKVPGVLDWSTGVYNPNVDISKDTTTLYASDRDVFLFLVDDVNPIEAGRLQASSRASQRRVIVKARIVRHRGARFTAAPLAKHLTYLKRDGVTCDGKDAALFGSDENTIDGEAFAERCADDRHHFRFIVSPEDTAELTDVRSFTRDLLTQMEKDLGTGLDWVAVDHWNTDNPHIHILVRGKADDGRDLVIDRSYISEGMRARAAQLVTMELGARTQQDIDRSLAREVQANRWTALDRQLQTLGDGLGGVVDLRPDPQRIANSANQHLIGRATKLERMGLAEKIAPGCWRLKPALEQTLRDLGTRGDIIRTMHRAMTGHGLAAEAGRFALHNERASEPVIGRLVERGLHNELTGQAYAVVDGTDGRVHHCKFSDIDMTGDAATGAIVELRSWTDRRGREQFSLLTHSDCDLATQERSRGATWLDKQLIASEPLPLGPGFGSEVEVAKTRRLEYLESEGLAQRRGDRFALSRNLLGTLRERDLADAGAALSREHGLPYRQSRSSGEVSGVYRQRIQLASGRFAMIDDGLGFSLVPWSKQLDRQLGQYVSGQPRSGGGIEWTLGRSRSIEI